MQKITTNTLEDTMYTRNIPIFTYKINYPFFITSCTQTAAYTINRYYSRKAKITESRCRSSLYPQALENAQYIPTPTPPFEPYLFQSDFKVTYNSKCITSLYFDEYTFLGGAHGSTERTSQTWDFQTGSRLTLRSFFPCCPDFRNSLFQSVEQQIAERLKETPSSYFDDYAELLRKTFDPTHFYLTTKGIVIYYQQYDIAPYATGITEFIFPFCIE